VVDGASLPAVTSWGIGPSPIAIRKFSAAAVAAPDAARFYPRMLDRRECVSLLKISAKPRSSAPRSMRRAAEGLEERSEAIISFVYSSDRILAGSEDSTWSSDGRASRPKSKTVSRQLSVRGFLRGTRRCLLSQPVRPGGLIGDQQSMCNASATRRTGGSYERMHSHRSRARRLTYGESEPTALMPPPNEGERSR